jgi:hypothetical protein
MSNLVVVAFDQLHQAEEVRLKLQKLQSEYLLDLADVVVAVKEKAGKAVPRRQPDRRRCGLPRLLWIVSQPHFPECQGRCCFWGACRCRHQRSLHQNVHVHANSRQFSAFRPHQNPHAERGPVVGRTEGARRQSFDDLAFARGHI